MRLTEIKDYINNSFTISAEKELEIRFIASENKDVPDEFEIALIKYNKDDVEQEGVKSFLFSSTQTFTDLMDIPFNLKSLRDIHTSILKENNLFLNYQIIYTDSLGTIIESLGEPINNGFKTDPILIFNGSKIQAIVQITAPSVFRNMLGILIASILIFFLILGCLIYEIKMFLTQHHLIQLRENFTHALTHDMKTPLATIHTVLDQLNKGTLDANPEMRNKFNSIATEQILNLQSIINQILTLAYIDKKQLSLNIQPVDLPQMIGSLIENFTVKNTKTICFSDKYDLKNIIAHADPFYFKNAISNLIDNAIKYSGESVKIDIECTAIKKNIYIRIRDNGLGIPVKDQQKIFEQFERGVEIKRKQISGFGLGLSYVKRVVEAHGGAIVLSSQEGVGSEFTITLPTELISIENDITE
jgi:two-component system phosphate regulon sensor histidine kinase PhoR